MALLPIDRGEVWLADLGMTAKTRPCLVLSVQPDPVDRVLFTMVPHTTSLHGTAFEVVIPATFLKDGAFDAQGLVTVPRSRLIRRLGILSPIDLSSVEVGVPNWLGL